MLLNKPLNYVSSQPEDDHEPAIKLLTPDNEFKELSQQQPYLIDENTKLNVSRHGPKALPKMAVCGRLDVNSTGLLLFTQDGKKYAIEKAGNLESETPFVTDVGYEVEMAISDATSGQI